VIDVLLVCSIVWLNHDQVGGNGCDNTWTARNDDLAGVARGATLHTGANDWRMWLKERNRLTHHVGPHQGAVCVVMLKERNKRGGHGDHLLRRYVHEVDARWLNKLEALALTAVDALANKVRVAIELCVRLGDRVALLFVGGEVDHVGRDATLLDAAIRRLNEAELIDAAEGCERADQADVRAFWRLNWADAAVVAVVNVANVEAGALSRESAWPECREASLAGEFGEWVGLIHELAQLRAAEELLHCRHNWAHVDERAWGRLVVFLNGHALLDDALHAQEADAEGVHDQLAVGAHAAVAKVVGHVTMCATLVREDQVANNCGEVFARQRVHLWSWKLNAHALCRLAEALGELVATNATQVITTTVEEEVLNERSCVVAGWWITRSKTLVHLNECLAASCGAILLKGVCKKRMLRIAWESREESSDLIVGLVANGAKQRRGSNLALAINLDVELILAARLELEPCATVWNHFR
jgi:hypothetical protein